MKSVPKYSRVAEHRNPRTFVAQGIVELEKAHR